MKGMLLIAFAFVGSYLTGCVTYRDAVISVQDAQTGEPLSDANVLVDLLPVFCRLNAGRVPCRQSGVTDESGQWSLTVPNDRVGLVIVFRKGYAEKTTRITEETFDDGKTVIELDRPTSGATTP